MNALNEDSRQVCQKPDTIRINDLVLPVSLQTGAQWPSNATGRAEQLISISLSIYSDISRAAQTDSLSFSIDYADIEHRIRTATTNSAFLSLQDVSRSICDLIPKLPSLVSRLDGLEICVKVAQLKAPLHCKTVAVEHVAAYHRDGSWIALGVAHLVEDLTCSTIIGVLDAERIEKQDVVVNLTLSTVNNYLDQSNWVDFRAFTKMLHEEIAKSEFLTLEALTSFVASKALFSMVPCRSSPIVSVRVAKPSALSFARSPEVKIRRTLSDYPTDIDITTTLSPITASQNSTDPLHQVVIAVGSNLGDSFRNIEYALRILETPQDILGDICRNAVVTVVNTSFLYETAPMYVIDQPSFINCACVVETNLSPTLLLQLLKRIESIVGRVPTIRNGPRAVDLDIIFYDTEKVDTRSDKTNLENLEGQLVIPHPRLQEREFVLRPLADMLPDYIHPILQKSIETLFKEICDLTAPPMNRVLPFPRCPLSVGHSTPSFSIPPTPETLLHWTYPCSRKHTGGQKTHVMATLNVTPDSFSDGATHETLPDALAYASSSVSAGATIVDIGGYSTRPGAAFVSGDEEIARVVPAVRALRDSNSTESQRMAQVPISVDTFRWDVAQAAIEAGANCINDVYAFSGPDSWPIGPGSAEYMLKLKAVARAYVVPVVLMHSRGDAGKNKDYSEYQYAAEATLEGVRVELGAKVNEIVLGKGGVRRWLVIADPGIGFSKTLEGNLEVLRGAQKVVEDMMIGDPRSDHGLYRNPLRNYPQLIGVSRKSFLGAILTQGPEGRETQPKERVFATAAAVTCAVQQGGLIIRVHDVKEMMDVVKVAEALWS